MVGKSKAKSAKKAAISSHPAFPAIVALWFATLLGFGSLVLPAILFEKLVTVTGIAALVPAAAPPLGLTARLLIAAVAGVAGIIAGLLVARKIAASQAPVPERKYTPGLRHADRHPDAPAKRPISAREELGSDSLDEDVVDEWGETMDPAEQTGAGRRRALAVTEEAGRSEYLDMAPLPGEGSVPPPAMDIDTHLDAGVEPDPTPAAAPAMDAGAQAEGVDFAAAASTLDMGADDALELDGFAEAEPEPVMADAGAPFAAPSGMAQDFASADAVPEYSAAPQETVFNSAPEPAAAAMPQAFAPPQPAISAAVPEQPSAYDPVPQAYTLAPQTVPESSAPMSQEEAIMTDQTDPAQQARYNPLGALAASHDPQPAPFAAPDAGELPPVAPPQPFAEPVADPAPEPVVPVADAAAPFAAAAQAAPVAAESMSDRPLAELGMAELVQRFAQSLEREKTGAVAQPAAPAMPAAQPPFAASAEQPQPADEPLELPAFAARPAAQEAPAFAASAPADLAPSAAAMQAVMAQAASEEAMAQPAAPAAEPATAASPVPEAAPAAAPTTPMQAGDPSVPAAFRAFDIHDEEEEDDLPDLSLKLGATSPKPFSAPQQGQSAPFAAPPAPAAMPAQPAFAQPAAATAMAAAQPAPAPIAEAPALSEASAMQAAAPAVPQAFADPLAQAEATPFADAESEDDEQYEEADNGYSSLLDMKRPLGSGRETVRIEDDGPVGEDAIEPVVVFPGQDNRRAAPAADGPSRDPFSMPQSVPAAMVPQAAPSAPHQPAMSEPAAANGPRPFDAPGGSKPAHGGFGGAASAQQSADPSETERALREALEKLNRMSGAA